MNVRMRSMSVLPVVLPFFLVAALTHSLSFATVAQNRAQKESASFKNVEETVSKLLSVPVYTASDEKLLNEAGDGAALAITRIVGEQEMNSPETGRRILLILHLAFEVPQSIIERNNKTPKAALRLLDQLEHTDYGRQPNVIAWIATIKPGMTRSDLLRVFTTEGGLSTRTHRTYVLKQCPTIKVDVEFSISGNEAEDKITQISRPYLDYGHYD